MQKVYLSKTQSGRVGLFTDRIIAWYFAPGDLEKFQADPVGFCKRLQFEYAPGRGVFSTAKREEK